MRRTKSHESVGGEPVPRLAYPVYPRGWEVCALIRGVQSRAGDGGDTFCIESGLQVLAESLSNGPRFVAVKLEVWVTRPAGPRTALERAA